MRDKAPTRPGPVQPDEPDRYEVESIVSHDFKGRHRGKLRFKTVWKGYPLSEATMTPGYDIEDTAKELIEDYLKTLTTDERNKMRFGLARHS